MDEEDEGEVSALRGSKRRAERRRVPSVFNLVLRFRERVMMEFCISCSFVLSREKGRWEGDRGGERASAEGSSRFGGNQDRKELI